jgi:lipopolysaccharide/colanic/teichoic acid biosynthesis glycosyltransferase
MAIKRFIDFVLAVLFIILSLPLILVISALIKASSKGPVFFTQERVGKNGRIFNIYKFRTMVENAEFVRDGLAVDASDKRITKLGAILRKTSLDEIPQFINVVIGDISIIGPRPALPVQLKYYNAQQIRRFDVRPGITGLATVKGRCSIPWSKRIELDIEYIDTFSLLLDLKIFVKTMYVVLAGKDTYYDATNGPAFDLAHPDDLPQAEPPKNQSDY